MEDWSQICIRINRIANGVVVNVSAGKHYADTELDPTYFPTLADGLAYAHDVASKPEGIMIAGKPGDEGPF